MRFKKKPVIIDAIQWTGDNLPELLEFGAPVKRTSFNLGELIVKTLEDGSKEQVQHIASIGDWIIRGTLGEYYACKPAAFADYYEPAE